MGWTKREFVVQALEEIGFSSYVYDAAPEQLQSVLRRLDAMVATWNAKGIRIGYPLPSNPNDSDLNEETNVPDANNEGVYLNLAVRIAPSFGKTLSVDTKQAAKAAYDALLVKAAHTQVMEMQFPNTLPIGAGNKSMGTNNRPYANTPVEPLLAGADSELDFS